MCAPRTERAALIVLIGAALAVASCKGGGRSGGDVARHWSPSHQDAYMGIPAADVQMAIGRRLAADPPAPLTSSDWEHVNSVYGTFGQGLLWLDDDGVHQPRVAALLSALASADSDALRLDAYPLAELSRALTAVEPGKPTAAQLAEADVLLSAAFTALGEHLLTGQQKPASLGQAWHINPRAEQVDSALVRTMREEDLAAGLARMRPQDPGYDSLRVHLGRLRQLLAAGGWATVPPHGEGTRTNRLAAARARLRAEGYLPDSATSGAPGVPSLARAISDFQTHHDLGATGTLNEATIEAMNVPVEHRLAQVAANMERYRWMPRTLGMRYILVNVPEFELTAFDSGAKSLQMKVIVGKDYEDRATPVFSDSMEFVIFRPYWNVTPDIAAKEVFPHGPGYLAANDMEIYYDHGRRAVRQRPGPRNALGLVKFIFPNDFNIYLHDTPNHELFKRDVRAFSHGCIRVERPVELAEWVLGWPADRVQAAMHGSNNRVVNLPARIPVYIVYFTAYVDRGHVNYGNDLYARDSALVDRMADAAIGSPETARAQAALRELAAR